MKVLRELEEGAAKVGGGISITRPECLPNVGCRRLGPDNTKH